MSLKFGILGLLHEQSMTGYEIYQYFMEYINPMWFAQQSQVYRDLGQLEKECFVTSIIEPQTGKPDKRVYTITDLGIHALGQWIEGFDFSESMRYRDSFALRIFFAGRMPQVAGGLVNQLEQYKTENQLMLEKLASKAASLTQAYQENQVAWDADEASRLMFFKLSLMRGQAQYEMNVSWADAALALLKNEASAPTPSPAD